MRILVVGDSPKYMSGKGIAMNELFSRVAKTEQVFVVGLQHYTDPYEYNGMTILPRNVQNDKAKSRLPSYFNIVKPDVLITFGDPYDFALFHDLERPCPWIAYVTIDSDTVSPKWGLDVPDMLIVPTEFGKQVLNKHGLKAEVVPHGANPKTFFPIELEKMKQVKKLMGLPEGCFVYGTVGRNCARKRWDKLFEAFSIAKSKGDVLLAHTDPTDQEIAGARFDLFALMRDLDIADDVFLTPMIDFMAGPNVEVMNVFYNAMNVFCLASDREGYGLPLAEAIATHTPCVGTNYASIPEVIGSAGYHARVSDYYCDREFNQKSALVDVEDFAKKMKRAKKNLTELKAEAAKRAPELDWKYAVGALNKVFTNMGLGIIEVDL